MFILRQIFGRFSINGLLKILPYIIVLISVVFTVYNYKLLIERKHKIEILESQTERLQRSIDAVSAALKKSEQLNRIQTGAVDRINNADDPIAQAIKELNQLNQIQ